jgi:MtN3 and saliva related transmembrane protein
MDTMQLVGIAAGLFTSVSMLPQVIKTIKEKKAEAISLKMLLVLITGLILWVVYGIMREDWPLIITNCLSILINLVMIFLRIKYKDK